MSGPPDAEALSALAELTAAVRAHVEWLAATGATGTPRGSSPTGIALPAVAAATAVRAVEAQGDPELLAAAPGAPPPPAAAPSAPPPLAAAPSAARGPVPVAAMFVAPAAAPSVPAPAPAPRVTLPLAERNERLAALGESIRGCTKCALHAGRTQTVFARGTGEVGLCFVGEGPGADEDAQGFPFVGKAGQLLDRMIEAMGFTRDQVYVCNIVKCRPPDNRKPEPDEMAACMPYLKEQLELLGPEVIVALGATAVQGLFGTSEGITRLRGRWKLYGGRVPVMPTFHPAFLLRNPAAKREVWDDLQAVLRQMGRVVPARK